MSIELFLIIAFAIICVILAAWVTVLSSLIRDVNMKLENMRRLRGVATPSEEK